jgi:hypothetical protein
LAATLSAASSSSPGLELWTGDVTLDQDIEREFTVAPFDRAVLSWNAAGPATFELEVDGRRHVMGHWGDRPRSETTASVDEDTLKLPRPATAFKIRALASPGTRVTLLAATFWKSGASDPLGPVSEGARGKVIGGVPHLVQSDQRTCSPTAVAMVLRFYGVQTTPAIVAAGVKDHAPDASEVFGNWPFNTAYAHKASAGRLASYVRRMSGLAELERQIVAGRPTIISYKPNGPNGEGHLVVVIGFTAAGDVVINDPGRRQGKGRVIARAEFHRKWLKDAKGVAYLIGPS